MYDYACAIFSPGGEMLAQSQTIPAQLGTMGTALNHLTRAIPLETWRPGDVLVCNDPYRGCTHTMDITLFSPVFFARELVGISSTIAHHIDIGGSVPCSTSVEIAEVFGEGLIFPPIRLIEGGMPNQAVFDFVAANVRDPRACLGDLRAQIAGCRTAERRMAELAEHMALRGSGNSPPSAWTTANGMCVTLSPASPMAYIAQKYWWRMASPPPSACASRPL